MVGQRDADRQSAADAGRRGRGDAEKLETGHDSRVQRVQFRFGQPRRGEAEADDV